MPRQDLIQVRRGTAAQWTSANPTLAAGEFGFESDTNKLKCGDGSTAWTSLSYLTGGSEVQNNYSAIAAPTTGDDSGDGYSVGSVWIDVTNDNSYICLDASVGSAVWGQTNGGGTASDFEYQTEITANTTLDGTQKGLNKVYPVNNTSARTITITTGDYVENDVINIERRGQGSVEIIADTGVRIRGVRDIENRYFINDPNSMVAVICRGSEEFAIVGNLKRGYTGAVTTSSYGVLREGDTATDVAVVGTGFSDNMLVTVSANATLNSFTVNSSTSLTLNMDAVGVENDTITVTYDNGDVYVDTDAITIAPASASELYNNYAFEYGWGLFKLKSAQTYGINVRRSSDNATTDVGFNGSGKIALDSTVSAGGTLTAWAGSDDVFIVTLYNQGGTSGFNLTQADTTKQAKFLNAGALITQSTVTMMEFDGSNDLFATSDTDAWADNDWTMFCNGNVQTTNFGHLIGWLDSTGADRMPMLRFSNSPVAQAFIPNDAGTQDILASGSLSTGTNYKIAAVSGSGGTELYVDGSSVDTGLAPSTTPTDVKPFEMGGSSEVGTVFLDGYMSYAVVYKSDQDTNISAIETIIDSYL